MAVNARFPVGCCCQDLDCKLECCCALTFCLPCSYYYALEAADVKGAYPATAYAVDQVCCAASSAASASAFVSLPSAVARLVSASCGCQARERLNETHAPLLKPLECYDEGVGNWLCRCFCQDCVICTEINLVHQLAEAQGKTAAFQPCAKECCCCCKIVQVEKNGTMRPLKLADPNAVVAVGLVPQTPTPEAEGAPGSAFAAVPLAPLPRVDRLARV